MTHIKINEKFYPATITGRTNDPEWDGRESKTITLEMTHAEAVETFWDDVEWSIVHQAEDYMNENGETVTPEPVEYDNSDFCVAGSITDHRDGTISVKMGKLTDLEETLALVYGGIE